MFLLKRNSIYYLEYFDEQENRIRRVSTKRKIKREALKFLTEFEENIKSKKTFKHILLEEFRKQYLDHIQANLSIKYYLNVKMSFNQLIEYIGNVPLSKLNYLLFDEFFTKTFSRTKQGAITYYRVLKSAFNKAVQWEYLPENPITKIKLPKIPLNRPIFITDIELKQIINYEQNPILKDIYLFAFYTGCRINEILNLKWSSINFSERIISIKNDDTFTTKSKKERTIPINNYLFENLKQ